ncbi:MAG: carboxypeptidase regulatory-like domain-containing protein, partial [Myxococcales bacterium]|nr:carboxypeptidase regulatory-like domain-containing protein [Myxococcales bacterium]
PEGRPVAGAEVCAWTFSTALASSITAAPSCAPSEPDGRYRIDGLHAVAYRVGASAPHRLPQVLRDDTGQRTSVALRAGEHREGLDLVLQPGGVPLRGVVRDAGGGPIEGAWVAGHPYVASGVSVGAQGLGARSDAEGRFTLWARPGSVTLTASASGYADGWTLAAAPERDASIALLPESVLVGTVRDPEDRPVEGAEVRIDVQSPGGIAVERTQVAHTDASGAFRFEQLPPGRYKPEATAAGLYGLAARSVRLGVGETSAPVELWLGAAARLEGRVLMDDPPGQDRGCPGAQVRLRGPTQLAATADDEGHVRWPAVPHGEYEVRVRCPGAFGPRDLPALEIRGDRDALTWTVRPGQRLRGVVVGPEGEPVGHAIVTASTARLGVAAPTPYVEVHTTAAGEFVLEGLAPDRYELVVVAEGHAAAAPLELEVPAEAEPEPVRVELRRGATVEGRVLDEQGHPVPGVLVRIGPERGLITSAGGAEDEEHHAVVFVPRFGFSGTTDGEGRFGLTGIPAGPKVAFVHTLQGATLPEPASLEPASLEPTSLEPTTFEVADGETVSIELRVAGVGATVRGVVLDEHGGPVADAFVVVEPGEGHGDRRVALPQLSDADGSFEIAGVPSGRHRVRATLRGGGE